MALFLSACSPVRLFNAVVPKDSGVLLRARDAAYGPDPRQRLDIYAPKKSTGGPLPIIVFFYGGSWNSGTKDGYGFVGRALASRGFIVAIPDYRVLPGIQYPVFLEDSAAAVRWVRAHAADYGANPEKLILAGHSAGAYNAAMLAIDPRWLGSDRRAVKGLIGLAGPYAFLPLEGTIARTTFGHVSDLKSTQPVDHVAADDPPAFLATGDKDDIVLPSNSDALAAKLTAAGVHVERRRYPSVGHAGLITAIAKPFRTRASVLDDAVQFARQTLLK